MKEKTYKISVSVLILLGLALISYPVIGEFLSSRQQNEAVSAYQKETDSTSMENADERLEAAYSYNKSLSGAVVQDPFVPDSGYVMPENYEDMLSSGNPDSPMGTLYVPKLNAILPVYHTVSSYVLEKGIGHMSQTALPVGGKGTHSVLAGHRGLANAVLFRDLDKMKVGDLFIMNVLNEEYAYEVSSINVVLPSDTSLLQPVEGQDSLTLLSCTPIGINSHRLLVTGTRTDIPFKDDPRFTPVVQDWMGVPVEHIALASGAGLIAVIGLIVLWKKPERKEKGK